jgi:hypothetical protein
MNHNSSSCKGIGVYLFLAFFWLVLGVLAQIFWADLERHAIVRIDRSIGGFVFFVLFSYNIIRWRLARVRKDAIYEPNETPSRRRRADQPIDPTFDISDSNPQDDKKKDPPVA